MSAEFVVSFNMHDNKVATFPLGVNVKTRAFREDIRNV